MTIEMNFDFDVDPQQAEVDYATVRTAARRHGIEITHVNPHGPGGGCPQLFGRGLSPNILNFLMEVYDTTDVDDIATAFGIPL